MNEFDNLLVPVYIIGPWVDYVTTESHTIFARHLKVG